MTQAYNAKFKAGTRLIPVVIEQENGRLFFHFKYNAILIEEIKAMEGRKYHGYDDHNPRKVWSVPITPRNLFQIDYLAGNNPFKRYDAPLDTSTLVFDRPLREHQKEMVAHGLQRRQAIIAGEMGTGKTLALIEIMERSGYDDWWYVAPSSALRAVELEFKKWQCKVSPSLYTYERLKRVVNDWLDGTPAPHGLVLDESQRVKTPTSQRSQAALHVANTMREEYREECYVLEASGSPAPRSPADWWHQAEIACPGFLKEGNIHMFRNRLGLIVQKETAPGAGTYPHLITWRDNEQKCQVCGKLPDDIVHDEFAIISGMADAHRHQKSVNEVAKLANRLKGLVLVKLKKDCLDLPDKQYHKIFLKPAQDTLNAARMIKNRCPTVITALTLLRELSDGFQYEDQDFAIIKCPTCNGSKKLIQYYDAENNLVDTQQPNVDLPAYEERMGPCPHCSGTGEYVQRKRGSRFVGSPKIDALKDLLDQHEDIGRFVVYGGFSETIDIIKRSCHEKEWAVIRVDGRGWLGETHDGITLPNKHLLEIFQEGHDTYEKIAFVGQPESAGIGITLTASPSELYYSNSFNGEARIQSEDRIHRLGMDYNRGANIYDLFHLDSDEFVYNNLISKKDLQSMSMGDFERFLSREVSRNY